MSGSTNYSGLVNYGTLTLGANLSLTDNKSGIIQFGGQALSSLDYKKIDKVELYYTAYEGSSASISYIDTYLSGTSDNQQTELSGTKKTYNFTFSASLSDTYVQMKIGFYNSLVGSKLYVSNMYLLITYTPNVRYKISTQSSPAEGGTTSGGLPNALENSTLEISATPGSGYTFKGWSDGSKENPRSVKATSNITYTAIFEPIPVTDLSLSHDKLSIKLSNEVETVYNYIDTLYRNRDVVSVSGGTCEIEPNYVILKSTGGDCHTGTYDMSGNPADDIVRKFMFDVSPGTEYTFKISANVSSGNTYAMFIFYYDSNYRYVGLDFREDLVADSTTFQSIAPANAAYCTVRLDNNVANNIVYYTNVVVYKESIDSNLYNTAAIAQIIEPYDALNKLGIWSSSNPDIVSVDESTGVLTAHNPGTATITCKARDATNSVLTKQCIVTVISTTNIYLGDALIVKVCLGDKRIKSAFLGDLSLL